MPGGQFRNHFNAVRLRATGSGNLECKLITLDDVTESILPSVALQATTDRYPTQLANLTTQRAQFEFRTTEFGAHFHINSILIYTKPVSSGFPQ